MEQRYTGTDLVLAALGGAVVGAVVTLAIRPRPVLPAGAALLGHPQVSALAAQQVPVSLWSETVKQNVARAIGVSVADLPRVLMTY